MKIEALALNVTRLLAVIATSEVAAKAVSVLADGIIEFGGGGGGGARVS